MLMTKHRRNLQTDRQTARQTDEQTDRRTDKHKIHTNKLLEKMTMTK